MDACEARGLLPGSIQLPVPFLVIAAPVCAIALAWDNEIEPVALSPIRRT